nr:polysaccharide deacetylase family protein [Peribacillus deserti]
MGCTLFIMVYSCSNHGFEPVTKNTEKQQQVKNKQTKNKKETEVIKGTEQGKPQYRINPNDWSIEPISKANRKIVLITIDDVPDKHAVEMAGLLKALGVPAIFFVNGHFIDSPEGRAKLRHISQMGFAIGNHTYHHTNLKELSELEQYNEIVTLNNEIEKITGDRPKFFRAPFGVNTPYSRKIAAQEKMAIMNWTYGYDWEPAYQNKTALTSIMVNSPYLTRGANLLMHDRPWTKEALPDIIAGLKKKGYGFVDPALIEVPS